MTKADVWMPLYIGDYYRDTRRLTTEQHGAYILLTMDYWTNGPPPDDPVVLAQITGLTPDAWSMHQAMLKHFFKVTDGHWRHKRIDEELEKAVGNKKRRSTKAKAGAEARWAKARADASSNAPSMPQALPEGCASPSPSPTLEDKPSNVVVPRKRASPKKTLDPMWEPSEFAWNSKCSNIVFQWSSERRADELLRFQAHHIGRANVMADWQAAWQTWVLNSDKFDRKEAENDKRSISGARSASADGLSPTTRAALAVFGAPGSRN